MGEALSRLAQHKTFQALLELEDPGVMSLPQLTRAIADLNRSSITVKKFQSEVRAKTKQVAKEVEKAVKSGGLSIDAAEAIKSKILGIVEA
jgi:hypothetical protein